MINSIPEEVQTHFDAGNLVAAIAQDSENGQVLMLAWMNQAALEQTITTKRGVYWSRSRGAIWVKGETSGHIQEVHDISYDCDGDAILLKVQQVGAACHTGERTCFHRSITTLSDEN